MMKYGIYKRCIEYSNPKQFGNEMFMLGLFFSMSILLIYKATLLMRRELHFILQIASSVS